MQQIPGGYHISQERRQSSKDHSVRNSCAMLRLCLLYATAEFLTVERGLVMLLPFRGWVSLSLACEVLSYPLMHTSVINSLTDRIVVTWHLFQRAWVCGVWGKFAAHLLLLCQFCGQKEADINAHCMDFASSVVMCASCSRLESISVLSKVVRHSPVLS